MSTMRLFHYAHYLSGFDYSIEYRTSLNNSNADYLSRFPVDKTPEHKVDRITIFQTELLNSLHVNSENIKAETQKDTELKPILLALRTGRTLKQFGYGDNEFTVQEDCLFRGSRVVIPKTLRALALQELHTGHVGMVKTKLLARSFIYWQNIDRDIENMVNACRTCRMHQNEPAKVPVHHWETPTKPWQRIHIDFAGPVAGHQLFILVDAFSKWVEIIATKTTTSTWCVNKLKDIFCTFGIPHTLISDNGRQFTSSEFETFLKRTGVVHRTSAPYHPATNGQAERFVQTIKKTLKKIEENKGNLHDKLRSIMRQLRRTPNSAGETPYEIMFGREIRTKLHVMFRKEGPQDNATHSNITTGIKMFTLGDKVQLRAYRNPETRWEFGKVLRRLGQVHYEIRTEDGGVVRRHVDQMLQAGAVALKFAAED